MKQGFIIISIIFAKIILSLPADYSGTESDEAAVKRYLREYLAELGFNREDFRENGKMYELGKYRGTIRKGYGKRKSLMKQYIKACKNEYKKDYREKSDGDKSEFWTEYSTTLTSSIMHFIH